LVALVDNFSDRSRRLRTLKEFSRFAERIFIFASVLFLLRLRVLTIGADGRRPTNEHETERAVFLIAAHGKHEENTRRTEKQSEEGTLSCRTFATAKNVTEDGGVNEKQKNLQEHGG
jgi:hypothetical protein